jgi:polysaccharide biosynthesis transport protein
MTIRETTTIRRDKPTAEDFLPHSNDTVRQSRTSDSAVGRSRAPAATPFAAPPEGLRLSSYVEIPFIHWRLIAGCFVASLGLAWLAMVVWPRSYESEAKLMVKVGRESVALDPTATTSQTLMLQKTQEEEVNSVLEVLSSRQIAQEVVKRLGAEAILDGVLPSTGEGPPESRLKVAAKMLTSKLSDGVDATLLLVGVKDPITPFERAVRNINKGVQINASKKSTVITIHAESKTPQMAQAIVATVTEVFLDKHLNVSRTEGSQTFFSAQSDEVENRLNRMVEERSQFMRDGKVVSVEDNRKILAEKLSAVERELFVSRGELEQSLAEIEELTDKAVITPAEIVSAREEQTDQTWSGMRQRVYELEILEKQYVAMYAPTNPKLVRVKEQLSGARSIMEKLASERVNRNMAPNPARLRMEEDLQKHQTKVVGLRSIIAEKMKQREEIQREVDSLLDFEMKLTEMNRNVAVQESNLRLLQIKREEARMIDELQTDRISNINTFQPATLVERPVSPKKPLLAVAFPMLGLMTGFGLAIVRETGKSTLRTSYQIRQKLGYPTIASIPLDGELSKLSTFVDRADSLILRAECRAILSELLLANGGGQARGRTLGILGVEDGCGASTIAAALALTSSEECGLRTTLIDADLKERSLSTAFGLNGAPGLVELLNGEANHRECVQGVNRTRLELVAGSHPSSKRPLAASSEALSSMVQEFQLDNDLVIVDLPPASRPDQAIAIAQHLDYVLLVVESDKTEETQAQRVLRRLTAGDAEVVGILLNKTRGYLPRSVVKFIG